MRRPRPTRRHARLLVVQGILIYIHNYAFQLYTLSIYTQGKLILYSVSRFLHRQDGMLFREGKYTGFFYSMYCL